MNNDRANSFSWDSLPVDHPIDLIDRRRIVGEQMMISHVTLHKGFRVPSHQHPNEQFAVVLSGKMRFEIFDTADSPPRILELGPDQVLHLPGGVPHAAEAIETSVVLDLFSPPTEQTGVDQK